MHKHQGKGNLYLLRTTIQIIKSTRRFLFFYPSTRRPSTINCQPSTGASFLYYYLSVYVNLSKNASSNALVFGKRVQRYDYFPNLQNFLRKIFRFYMHFSFFLIFVKPHAESTPYLLYIGNRRKGKFVKRKEKQ